jgi:hypothetical protein
LNDVEPVASASGHYFFFFGRGLPRHPCPTSACGTEEKIGFDGRIVGVTGVKLTLMAIEALH